MPTLRQILQLRTTTPSLEAPGAATDPGVEGDGRARVGDTVSALDFEGLADGDLLVGADPGAGAGAVDYYVGGGEEGEEEEKRERRRRRGRAEVKVGACMVVVGSEAMGSGGC